MTLIKISNLSKTYRKGKVEIPALKDATCEIEQGAFVSITGKSGSGKSTLLNESYAISQGLHFLYDLQKTLSLGF